MGWSPVKDSRLKPSNLSGIRAIQKNADHIGEYNIYLRKIQLFFRAGVLSLNLRENRPVLHPAPLGIKLRTYSTFIGSRRCFFCAGALTTHQIHAKISGENQQEMMQPTGG